MLTFTSEHRLEEVRWMPNGDLIGLQMSEERVFDVRTVYPHHWYEGERVRGGGAVQEQRREAWSEIVLWTMQGVVGLALKRFNTPSLFLKGKKLFVNPSGSLVLVWGHPFYFFRLEDQIILTELMGPDRRENRGRPPELLAVSPDYSRILYNSQNWYGPSCQQMRLDGREVEERFVAETQHVKDLILGQVCFFYSPENILYRKRSDFDSVDRITFVQKHVKRVGEVLEAQTTIEHRKPPLVGNVVMSCQSNDGSIVVLVTEMNQMAVMYFEEPIRLVFLQRVFDPRTISSIAIHPSNRFLVISREASSRIEIVDIARDYLVEQFDWNEGHLHSVDCSYDGTMIAAVAGENKIIVWDVDF